MNLENYKDIELVEEGFYKRDLANGNTIWLQVRPFNNYLGIAKTGNMSTFDDGW